MGKTPNASEVIQNEYNSLEVARIIGQPLDPRKKYPEIVDLVCETDTADPDEHVYYYDVIQDTDKIINIASDGTLTSESVTPDTDVEFTFVDTSTPEYYVSLMRLASAKERTLLRKKATINRALDAKEINYVLTLIANGVQSGNKKTLGSGETTFTVKHAVQMVNLVKDYGNKFVLFVSSQIWEDIILWNYNDDKNIDIFKTFEKLNISIVRIPNQSVTISGSATDLIASTRAYLVAVDTNTTIGTKPLLFVRKRLDDVKLLGGVIAEDGEKPERLIFTSQAPMNVSGTRYMAVGMTGYEQVVAAVTNPYALAQFTRS